MTNKKIMYTPSTWRKKRTENKLEELRSKFQESYVRDRWREFFFLLIPTSVFMIIMIIGIIVQDPFMFIASWFAVTVTLLLGIMNLCDLLHFKKRIRRGMQV